MSAGRIAVLVIAHANPATFRRLVAALRDPRIAVFVHLDARAEIARFQGPGQDHVTFIAPRIENHWGAFTQVEVALALFRAARAAGPFDSHALISGDSLPLVTNDVLAQVLSRCGTLVPMRVQRPGDKSYRRVTEVYVPGTRLGRIRGHDSHLDRHLTEADLEAMQRAMRTAALKRAIPFEVYKGSQWIALADPHLGAMLDFIGREERVVELFRWSLIPDELFFHTILRLVDPGYVVQAGIMGADWTRRPKPGVLRGMEELAVVRQATTPFFRKFCDQGAELAETVLSGRLDEPALRAARRGTVARWLREGPRRAEEPPPPEEPAAEQD